jgi:uroporphyrinogen-III decarboxylase
MTWTREEYIELMTFGESERPMFVELFGPLVGLEDEWRAQGAAPDEIGLHAFGFDSVPTVHCGGSTGMRAGFAPVTLEETETYKIERDAYGRTVKLFKHKATIPLPLDYPVADMDSWLRLKPWFTFREDRIDWDQVRAAKQAQERGALVLANIPGGFDLPRQLMGEEAACVCYYDDPGLMHDILNTITDTAINVLSRVSEQVTVDCLAVHEDMAGKSGPLAGPSQIREFIKPYYRAVWELLSSRGTKLFSQDSDGDMSSVICAFLDCGVNVLYPAEPAAGMDIVELRKRYGDKLAFKGGIDKHVLRQDKAAIRRELEYKMQPMMRRGTVFGLDHRIPNGTPLEHYRYYVNTAREILGLPPAGKNSAWQRMAF